LRLFSNYLRSSSKEPLNTDHTSLPSYEEFFELIMEKYPFTEILNQVMRFGEIEEFATPLAAQLAKTGSLFPDDIMARKPLFDQMICNYYEPGQGIAPHVDLLSRFEDGIVILSLGSSCVMDFRPVTDLATAETYKDIGESGNEEHMKSVLLQPGDVLSISGEARYQWTHGIASRLVDEWEGKSIPRGKRISVTLRKLLPSPDSSTATSTTSS